MLTHIPSVISKAFVPNIFMAKPLWLHVTSPSVVTVYVHICHEESALRSAFTLGLGVFICLDMIMQRLSVKIEVLPECKLGYVLEITFVERIPTLETIHTYSTVQ